MNSELWVRGMSVEEPFQFFLRFLVGRCAYGEVPPDVWVAVEREEAVEVAGNGALRRATVRPG